MNRAFRLAVAVFAVGFGSLSLASCIADPPPLIGVAIACDRQATVSWQAPLAFPFPIVAYEVTPWVGQVKQTPTRFDSTATTETVTGLTNGTTYTFTVLAYNTLGNDTASSGSSNPVTPTVGGVIACENAQPGDARSDWTVAGSGDPSIQGFATAMSVTPGETVSFKIKTPASAYHIDILRMGYYGGNGARKLARTMPTAPLPQSQPACLTDASTRLLDCGDWAVSAAWAVPVDAVSGVYMAHLVRDDTGGSSRVIFVVRDDTSHSDFVYQTSDSTWQAYNTYGGISLYIGLPPASKVSYNRPFNPRGPNTDPQAAEFPLISFLEANGYDVSYTSGSDVDRRGSLLLNHKVFLSAGHDEYWSGGQRANVEAARDAGVNLAFLSGNELFWKTRWEPSIDGTSTPYRTLVTYKETTKDAPIDPQDPPTWTGTWRDPRFSPPADGGRPENALSGQLLSVTVGTTDIQVPAQYGALRFWRNTAVAGLSAGQTLTLAPGTGTLGYEWDDDPDNGSRPAGLIELSSTTASVRALTDYGGRVADGVSITHHLTLYRAPSGALVFGAGTIQWSWGLDASNPAHTPVDATMQQAMVNLFADMGAQPATLLPGLVPAAPSTDIVPPSSTIDSPLPDTTFHDGDLVTITGTAVDDGGGEVAGVEVSTDSGATWHPAVGAGNWTYTWSAHGSPSTRIISRAVDDSGNLEASAAGSGSTIDIVCPCSLWASAEPRIPDSNDANGVEVGVKLRSDVDGYITAVRFYKTTSNTGAHIGNLWTADGELLATATSTNETASGWQQLDFTTPVPITAGTVYVASYYAPNGHYSTTPTYFYPAPSPAPDGGSIVDSPPLHALRNTGSTTNGLLTYSEASTFPMNSSQATNFWVDAVFSTD